MKKKGKDDKNAALDNEINKSKTSSNSTQVLKHLGVIIDTKKLMFFAPLEKLNVICRNIDFVVNKVTIPARTLAKILGQINLDSCDS